MKEKHILLILLSIFLILPISVIAITNLDFRIEVEDKIYFPNETIPVNISVQNRDVSFDANDVVVSIKIGKRTFDYEFGDIKSQKSVIEDLTLPEYPPGDYVIKGELNFTDFFGEIDTIEMFNSFHVRFPEIERLPRNIIIKDFIISEEIIAGETHSVSIKVSNEGTVGGDLLIELSSMEVSKSKKIHLDAGETGTVNLDVEFYNPGVSKVEGRVFGLVDDEKYLLAYDVTDVFIKESNVAKLSFEKIEPVNEADKQINQNDVVKLKIYLKNSGNWMASNVNGVLSSSISGLEVTQYRGNFGIISKNELSSAIFEIKTSDSKIGSEELLLEVDYTDGLGEHKTSFKIPLDISEGEEPCYSNNDCLENQICSNNKCVDIPCECGEVVNRECIPYVCCSNLDCEEGYICSDNTRICEPSQQIKADVLIVTSSKLKTSNEYEEVLKEYRKTILKEGLTSFYILIDSPKVQELFNIEPANPKDWRSVKKVLDKITCKVKPDYLLILGGVDIIPQPPAKTEAEIPIIPLSDDRYADIDLDGIPDIASGRIPIDDVKTITDYLDMLVGLHKKMNINDKLILGDACGGHNCFLYKDIDYVSDFVFGVKCEQSSNCLKSPPYCSGKGSPPIFPIPCENKNEMMKFIENSDFIFFGAHGDGKSFVSIEDEIGLIGDLILSGEQIYKMNFSKKFIMTFACFGGSIDVSLICLIPDACAYPKLKPSKSTALASVYKKSPIYIGNTRFGYGGISAQLFKEIYNKAKNGETIGNAILKMKQEKLKNAWSDWYRAVIYEIQLYGDPTINLIGV